MGTPEDGFQAVMKPLRRHSDHPLFPVAEGRLRMTWNTSGEKATREQARMVLIGFQDVAMDSYLNSTTDLMETP